MPGGQVFSQPDWDNWTTFNFVFLPTGPDGALLVDCGIDDPVPLNDAIRPDLGPHACIEHLSASGIVTKLLSQRGLTPSDMFLVALTDLHAGHAGNLGLVLDARVVVGRRGWEGHLQRRQTHAKLVASPAFPPSTLMALVQAGASGRLILAHDEGQVGAGLGPGLGCARPGATATTARLT